MCVSASAWNHRRFSAAQSTRTGRLGHRDIVMGHRGIERSEGCV